MDATLTFPMPCSSRGHRAKKGSDGAVPAVVANGPHLGAEKWVKPRQDLSRRAQPRAAGEPPQKKPLAERQEQKGRQRKVHAIGLLKAALLHQPPPPLATSVRLAIVFGTAQTHSSSGHGYDTALPRVAPDVDLAAERRRMLGGEATASLTGAAFDRPAASPSAPSGAEPAPHQETPERREGLFWRTFDALAGQDAAGAEFLWARTLRVMLDRMTPNGDWRHVDVAWHEAERVAPLAGLDAQTYLDQASPARSQELGERARARRDAQAAGQVRSLSRPAQTAGRAAQPLARPSAAFAFRGGHHPQASGRLTPSTLTLTKGAPARPRPTPPGRVRLTLRAHPSQPPNNSARPHTPRLPPRLLFSQRLLSEGRRARLRALAATASANR
jgi:hypothetical protein